MESIAEWTQRWAKSSNLQFEYMTEVDSTNAFAKGKDFDSSSPLLVISENQTAGRGRGKNTWVSPQSGSSLFSSWCFGFTKTPQPITTALVGLALFRSAQQIWKDLAWSLKAPNDLFINDTKVAGILVENITEASNNRLVIGIGINVNATPEVENAGSISQHLGKDIGRHQWWDFLNSFLVELTQVLNHATETTLPSYAQNDLKIALNQNPNLQDEVKEIRPDGSIVFENRVLLWHEL